MTVEELLADKRAMLEWIGEKEPFDLVGFTGNASDCPVARFVRERLGITYPEIVSVVPGSVAIISRDQSGPQGIVSDTKTQAWVQQFMAKVDLAGERNAAITASRAWDILDNEVSS